MKIGGRKNAIGSAIIQFIFKNIEIVLKFELLLLSETVPSLLSLRDLVVKDLDI